MAMKIKMKNIFGALGALALVLGAGPAPAAEAFKAGLVEVFARLAGPWQQGFLEGPVFDAAGNLWVVEIYGGHISKITPDGQYQRFLNLAGDDGGGANGMKMDRQGRLIIAHRTKGIVALDPKTKQMEVLVDNYKGTKLHGPNDLFFDSKGNLWFTDPGTSGVHSPTGAVYRLAPDGGLFQVFNNLSYPNGIALSPDEQYLYVTELGNNRLVKAYLREDRSVWFSFASTTFNGGWGPDGIALDTEGNLYIAQFDGHRVNVVDPQGYVIGVIDTPANGTTNVAFGPDGHTLYVTEGWTNTVYRVKVNKTGAKLWHQIK